MTLQTKTLLVISLTFIGLIAALFISTQVIVLGSFSQQEDQDMRQNVERVRSALVDNLESLEGTARDWSLWDDTYAYIQDRNQAFVDSNLSDNNSMATIRLNLEMFVNLEGQVLYQKSLVYDAKGGDQEFREITAPASLQHHIYRGSPLLYHADSDSSLTGILYLPDAAPMLIASEPIAPSSGEGSVAGTVIFGRYLDEAQIERLAKTHFSGLTLQSLDAADMPADFRQVISPLRTLTAQAETINVQALNSSVIAGYTLIKDIYGKPAFIMKVEMARDVYTRGLETVRYFMFALLGVGVIFGVVVLTLLKKMVLSRVARLNRDTGAIALSGDTTARVSLTGSDELSHLAVSMNKMLAALQKSHEELREGEERYRAVVEQTTEAIFLIDNETRRFLEANAASQILLGYSAEELKQITLDDILVAENASGQTNSRLRKGTGPLHTTGTLRLAVERRYRRKNGTVVPVEVSDSHILYGGRDVLCVVARDITDRKRAEYILREMAMKDGLTGLLNRREMHRILKERVELYERYAEPSALIMLDVDHFKSVNDTYGHRVGDDVLRWLAHLISELARPEDNVARYGGEELAVIMPGAAIEDALEIAERLRLAVSVQPFQFTQAADGDESAVLVPITISLGVAVLSSHTSSEQGLIEAADQALYEAKRAGRNRTVAYSTLSVALQSL